MNRQMLNVVLKHECQIGEGPVWDRVTKSILWVDIPCGEIHRFVVETGEHSAFKTGSMIGSFAIRASGGIIAALQRGFSEIDLEKKSIQLVADPGPIPRGVRFNDGKCDPAGRFWAGTMSIGYSK